MTRAQRPCTCFLGRRSMLLSLLLTSCCRGYVSTAIMLAVAEKGQDERVHLLREVHTGTVTARKSSGDDPPLLHETTDKGRGGLELFRSHLKPRSQEVVGRGRAPPASTLESNLESTLRLRDRSQAFLCGGCSLLVNGTSDCVRGRCQRLTLRIF